MVKKRYGSLAVILHLIAPGLGFLYSGKPLTALFIPLIFLASLFFIAWSRLILEPWGIWLVWGGLVFVYLLLLPFVFFIARRNSPCILAASQRGVVYFLFVFILLVLSALTVHYRAILFGYETFILPSRSMANTLLPNDYIIVDTWAYLDKAPQRGDILVFKPPLSSDSYFTKRLIAKPGDHLVIHRGKVTVNDKTLREPYVLAKNNKLTAKQKEVSKEIKEGQYFVMGDNRDHSNDSRSWGLLDKKAIYGKAISIWFSFSAHKGVRMERIKKLGNINSAN